MTWLLYHVGSVTNLHYWYLQYKKAITAISGLDYEITAANAQGLGKGKTKLVGIGKSTADKIHEYYTTGAIQKLVEKRMINS